MQQMGMLDMRTVSIFRNGNNQTVRLPADMAYEGVSELVISRSGDTVILRPVRPNWLSLADQPKASPDFLQNRVNVVGDDGRFSL